SERGEGMPIQSFSVESKPEARIDHHQSESCRMGSYFAEARKRTSNRLDHRGLPASSFHREDSAYSVLPLTCVAPTEPKRLSHRLTKFPGSPLSTWTFTRPRHPPPARNFWWRRGLSWRR